MSWERHLQRIEAYSKDSLVPQANASDFVFKFNQNRHISRYTDRINITFHNKKQIVFSGDLTDTSAEKNHWPTHALDAGYPSYPKFPWKRCSEAARSDVISDLCE